MTFADAVTTVFSRYATFSGRARRSEYWWFALFNMIVSIVVDVVGIATHTFALGLITALALFLPSLAVTVRRLHDTGRTGWWIWIALVPLVGAIVMLVFLCQDSEPGMNKYGDCPKYDTWEDGFAGLHSYLQREGHSRVPVAYRDSDGIRIGQWVGMQRRAYRQGNLEKERTRRLEALQGWTWDDA